MIRFDVHMSERAAEALFADGRYPLREQLTAVLKKYGIEESMTSIQLRVWRKTC